MYNLYFRKALLNALMQGLKCLLKCILELCVDTIRGSARY